jgi:hypothetical protein
MNEPALTGPPSMAQCQMSEHTYDEDAAQTATLTRRGRLSPEPRFGCAAVPTTTAMALIILQKASTGSLSTPM